MPGFPAWSSPARVHNCRQTAACSGVFLPDTRSLWPRSRWIGAFFLVRRRTIRLSPPFRRLLARRWASCRRPLVYRRWPSRSRHRRSQRRQSWPAEKSTLQNGLQTVFSPSPGPGATRQPENASWAAYRGGKACLDHSAHRPGFAPPSLKTGFQTLASHQRLCSRAHTRPVERWPRRRRGQRDLSGS